MDDEHEPPSRRDALGHPVGQEHRGRARGGRGQAERTQLARWVDVVAAPRRLEEDVAVVDHLAVPRLDLRAAESTDPRGTRDRPRSTGNATTPAAGTVNGCGHRDHQVGLGILQPAGKAGGRRPVGWIALGERHRRAQSRISRSPVIGQAGVVGEQAVPRVGVPGRHPPAPRPPRRSPRPSPPPARYVVERERGRSAPGRWQPHNAGPGSGRCPGYRSGVGRHRRRRPGRIDRAADRLGLGPATGRPARRSSRASRRSRLRGSARREPTAYWSSIRPR